MEITSKPLSEEEIISKLIPSNIDKQKILDLHSKFKSEDNNYSQNKSKWLLKKLSFENILKYRGKHSIDFVNLNGIIGISGLNASGKSSLLKILIFALSGEISVDFSQVNVDYVKTSQGYNYYKFDTANM